MKTRCFLLAVIWLYALGAPLQADDWLQWRGLDRKDISTETGLLQSWPKGGPKLLWTCKNAGAGYAGPSIHGDQLLVMGANGPQEFVFTLDVKTGKKGWSTMIGPLYKNDWGNGPRGTPTIDGNQLFVISGQGMLVCLELATGQVVWKKSLVKDLGGQIPSWGYAESPLIDGDKVVCTPGGRQGAVAALDKKTGKVLWQSQDFTDPAQYSSLVISQAGGVKQYVQMTGQSVAGVGANDGKLLWRFLRTSRVAAVPTPIVQDDLVYVTSGYGCGSHLLRISGAGKNLKVREVYASKGMENHHGGAILIDGYVYGHSNHGGWKCQDFKTGKFNWNELQKLGKGSCTCAGGRLYLYSEREGNVVLLEPSPEQWKEHGRFTIPNQSKIRSSRGGIWTHPVVANGRLYLRDQDLIYCYDVRAQ
jgi:outer membrane protein assembly factor BamB